MARGINPRCAQCINECKQDNSVTLIECPKFRRAITDPVKLAELKRQARHRHIKRYYHERLAREKQKVKV